VFDSFSGADETGLPSHPPDLNAVGSPWMTTAPAPAAVLRGQRLGVGLMDPAVTMNAAVIEADTPDGTIGVDWHAAQGSATAVGYPVGAIIFRVRDVANYLIAGFNLGGHHQSLSIWRVEANVATQLALASVPPPDGRTHRLEVVLSGPQIELWVDGVRHFQVSEWYNSWEGTHGLRWVATYDAVSTFDHFTIRGTRRCATIGSSASEIGAAAGVVTVPVTAASDCTWTATSLSPWLQVTAPAGGTGSGQATILASPNMTATARTGGVLIGGGCTPLRRAPASPVCRSGASHC
jgi:hypothetical protein